MQQVALTDVIQHVQKLLAEDKYQEVEQALTPAMNQFPENPALWFFAGYYLQRTGRTAMAVEAWRRSYDLEPQAQVLANIGAMMKDTGRPDQARAVLTRALDMIGPESSGMDHVLANLIGCHVNEGCPGKGIEAAKGRAITAGQAKFNLALLNLEAGNFRDGFRLYAEGFHDLRQKRAYEGAVELTAENFAKAKGKRLIVYGEQGIGDELMFATMLGQVADDFELTFDHHPRLVALHESSPWAKKLQLRATRKTTPEWYSPGDADYCCPIANLGQFYRTDEASFAWRGPYYSAPLEEVMDFRQFMLGVADGRKIIGLSVRGGSIKTNVKYRSIDVSMLDEIIADENRMFVVLDYDDVTDVVDWVANKHGREKLLWFPSITWAWDYYHKASLVEACDAVLTVCQSVAHLSAAMGKRTHVLTPSRCAWRYGAEKDGKTRHSGEPWYWYPGGHAILHRQQGDDWEPAIKEAAQCLK